MAQQVLSVSQINEYIRQKMDEDALLSGVAVKGEISNYKVYPSGHHYFTIKDENAALKCVMFKGNAMRLRFRPDNGLKVIVMGKISVYPRDGAYQFYCATMVLDGIGDLYVAFEQLKEKMAAKGLIDPNHKKPIPQYPDTIGIITSEAGAAVHDMLRILKTDAMFTDADITKKPILSDPKPRPKLQKRLQKSFPLLKNQKIYDIIYHITNRKDLSL